MIKFFRNIRQSLLMENKNAKYLKYAIGEIVLVVIGILIALQVNNWNENQKAKSSETTILEALLKEFRYNQELLNEMILINRENIANALEIGNFTGPSAEPVDEKTLSELMVGAFKFNVGYSPSSGTLLDLINSGKLSFLKNQELRAKLASYESDLDNVNGQEEEVNAEQAMAHQYFISTGNFRRHLDIIKDALIEVTPSGFAPNQFTFLQNPEFENHLYYYAVMASNLDKVFYKNMANKQQLIIDLIQIELDEPH